MAAAAVVALAFAARLAWVLLVPTKPVGDFAMYLESAEHLLAHGALDSEYIYMPGYVFMLAACKALGGGVLAAKMIGVVAGALGAGAAYGIAYHLWDRRAAWVAGAMAALWPAGIAVASVTGTDMPAAALMGLASLALLRVGERRPMLGALLFGVGMGLAAYMRAVAVPLVVLGAPYFRAAGASWRQTAARTGIAVGAAMLLLVPWGMRNAAEYGELFFTDSHGGLTALVGANPNSEGTYSRSLNWMFREVTGHAVLAQPHRDADRAGYALARQWSAFEPAYALGLVVRKAERLLGNERPLLYWPLFRAGVLTDEQAGWFAGHRHALETVVDLFWVLLAAAGVTGLALAVVQRRWIALAFVPTQLALCGIYAIFFAEARYHLPIALLLFPSAAGGLLWGVESMRRIWRERRLRAVPRHELVACAVAMLLVFGGWPALLSAGEHLRVRHQWAATVCEVPGESRFCLWRSGHGGATAVQGVWDGVGVKLPATLGTRASAITEIDLPAGDYELRASVDLAPTDGLAVGQGSVSLVVGQAMFGPVEVRELMGGQAGLVTLAIEHPGGALRLRLDVIGGGGGGAGGGTRVWLTRVSLEGGPSPSPPAKGHGGML